VLFNSLEFILFFPIVCLVYYLLPGIKGRTIFLLLASYYFYMCWEPVYAVKKLKNKQNITTTKELPKVSGGLKAVSIDNKNMTDKLMAYDMSQSQTTVLQPVGETTVLGAGYGETTVIGVSANAAQPQAQDMQQDQNMQNTQIAFVVCEDITLCEGNAI
jgi:hypothetical protein